jgi:arylsulfatase A-like enzyme/Tfp pilus assembly protein PilF
MGKKKPGRIVPSERAPGGAPRARRLAGRWLLVVTLAASAAAAGWIAWSLLWRGQPPDIRRTADQNVLLITIDTWRADALGASGSGKAATPNLDQLAALGTRFDFAHAHAVVTLPSHASILTGQYPFQHGVRENSGFRLEPSTLTLASMLRAQGFATGAFVGSFALDSRFGLGSGFGLYDERYGKSNLKAGFVIPERRADAVVSSAVKWIEGQKGKWFAWVHVFDPHAPYQPPPPFDREYADHPYFGEVAYTDRALATLLDAARDSSGRPTLAIVTGDHGEGLCDHGEMTHGLFAYEATLRVPLIVAQVDRSADAWTGSSRSAAPSGGVVSNIGARHVDIMPTVLDALGVTAPGDLPGASLLFQGRDNRPSYFEALSASLDRGWAPLTGVLSGREKFVSLPIPELYDLAKDAAEAYNLADREPGRRQLLQARLDQFGAAGPRGRAAETAEVRARLRALGYVTGNAPRKERYTEDDDPKRLVGLDARLRRAIELYERKQPLSAVPLYRQIIAERPTMEVAYTQLAMLHWDLGQPAEAVATLREALRAGIASAHLRAKLGIYLAESGHVKEALPLLREATAADQEDLDALNALGIALGRAGEAEQAAAAFERILHLDPSNTLARENLGAIALSEGRWEDARKHFAATLALDPESPQAHNGLGVVEMKSGNRSAAIRHWQQAVARDPRNFDALYNLAVELLNDGQAVAARPYLEQFARTAPPAFYAGDLARVRNLLARMRE